MNKTISKFLILGALLPSMAFAQLSISKNDFAFGQEIEINEHNSVVEILLPDAVYNTSKNLLLMDLAVFNANGEPVPHSILNLEQQEAIKEMPPQSVPLFPIYGKADSPTALKNIKISTNGAGAVVEISSDEKMGSNKLSPEGYLVDASKIEDTIDHFQMEFASAQKNKVYSLIIEGSNDLKNWTSAVNGAVVAWFEMNGQKIVQDTVENASANFKFYKISLAGDEKIPAIKAFKVYLTSKIERIKATTISKDVIGKKIETPKTETSYAYDLGGNYPVLGIAVKFKDRNSMARFSILAAHQENGPWSGISNENFFTITKNEKQLDRLSAEFPKNSYRYWKMQLISDPSGIGQKFPDITFNWQPHRLQFLARGDGPFMLAYGSSKVVSTAQTDFTQFGADEKVVATLKPQISLGGQAQLVFNENTPINYRKYVLWAILLVGVLVIGLMALHVKNNTSSN